MVAHLGEVVRAVVAALEARELVPPGEDPGQPEGEHGRLGSGVAEPDELHRRHPATELLGQFHLQAVGGGKARTTGGLGGQRVHDLGVGVPEDHGRVVADEVEPPVPVHVPDPAALAALDCQRMRLEEGRGAGAAFGQDPPCPLVQLARERRGGDVGGLGVGQPAAHGSGSRPGQAHPPKYIRPRYITDGCSSTRWGTP